MTGRRRGSATALWWQFIVLRVSRTSAAEIMPAIPNRPLKLSSIEDILEVSKKRRHQ